MLLYKFMNAKWGLTAIRDRRIKFTRVLAANDPFEFLGLAVSDRAGRAYLRKKRQELDEACALLCLAADWKHPLMWAHYADNHQGICLCFDVSTDHYFWPVSYLPRRLELEDLGKASASEIDTADIVRLMYSKFDGWSYEQEFRTHTPLEPELLEKSTGHYFHQFGEKLRLRKVMVGYKSLVTRAQILDALGSLGMDVESFKVRPAFKDFSLTRNLRNREWR